MAGNGNGLATIRDAKHHGANVRRVEGQAREDGRASDKFSSTRMAHRTGMAPKEKQRGGEAAAEL